MRKILIVIVAAALVGLAAYLHFSDQPKAPVPSAKPPVIHKSVPSRPLLSTVPEYNDCYPKTPTTKHTKAQQQEILDVVRAMQQEEKISGGQITPGLQALDDKYADLVARYDTCTVVAN